MTIDIHEPKIEALLQQWMESGRFSTLEDAVAAAIEAAPLPSATEQSTSDQTGAVLYEALQRCPYPDVDLEPERIPMPVREFHW